MSRRGFTLIEVMIAVGILAMVMTLIWGSFDGTFRTKKDIEAQAGRYRTVRIALDRMARELSMAYLSQNEDTSQPNRRTLFVGKHKLGVDEVEFSYFGHQRLYQDADECDTAEVMYYGVRDPEDNSKTDLARRETRRLSYQKIEEAPGEADIVCDDIVSLKLKYWDARDKQWRDEWVTTSADGEPDRLPSKVQITLTVHDERGQEVPFTTEARIAMQEPLNLRAVDLQTTPGTPAPGTPGTPAPGTAGTPSTTAATALHPPPNGGQ